MRSGKRYRAAFTAPASTGAEHAQPSCHRRSPRPPPRSVAVAQLPPAQPHDVYVTLAASLLAPPSRSPPCALTRCPLHPLHITKTALCSSSARQSRAPVPAPYAPLPRQLRNARAAHSAPPAWHVLRNPPSTLTLCVLALPGSLHADALSAGLLVHRSVGALRCCATGRGAGVCARARVPGGQRRLTVCLAAPRKGRRRTAIARVASRAALLCNKRRQQRRRRP